MTITRKQITWTVITTLLFYGAGRLMYQPFYRLTVALIQDFSNHKLRFFGKYPFVFFGDPVFGWVCAGIPLTFLLCFLILAGQAKKAFWWTVTFYLIILVLSFLMTCYLE